MAFDNGPAIQMGSSLLDLWCPIRRVSKLSCPFLIYRVLWPCKHEDNGYFLLLADQFVSSTLK